MLTMACEFSASLPFDSLFTLRLQWRMHTCVDNMTFITGLKLKRAAMYLYTIVCKESESMNSDTEGGKKKRQKKSAA